jgi:hypothetical protein
MGERRSLLLVESGGEPMEEISLRLRQMGLHVIRTKTLDQAMEALRDARYVIGAAVLPPELPALDLESAVVAFRRVEPDGSLSLMAHGPRPDADRRARMRRSGVEYALWLPLDDNTLRFQVNRALAGGGPPVSSRKALRVPTNWPVRVESGGRDKPAKVYCVSARGAFLATHRPSLPRARVEVSLPLPEADLRVRGEVVMTTVPGNLVRRNLPIGMGIRFTGQAEGEEEALARYAEERLAWLRV